MRYSDGGDLWAAERPAGTGAAGRRRDDRGRASDRDVARRFWLSRMSANRWRRALATLIAVQPG